MNYAIQYTGYGAPQQSSGSVFDKLAAWWNSQSTLAKVAYAAGAAAVVAVGVTVLRKKKYKANKRRRRKGFRANAAAAAKLAGISQKEFAARTDRLLAFRDMSPEQQQAAQATAPDAFAADMEFAQAVRSASKAPEGISVTAFRRARAIASQIGFAVPAPAGGAAAEVRALTAAASRGPSPYGTAESAALIAAMGKDEYMARLQRLRDLRAMSPEERMAARTMAPAAAQSDDEFAQAILTAKPPRGITPQQLAVAKSVARQVIGESVAGIPGTGTIQIDWLAGIRPSFRIDRDAPVFDPDEERTPGGGVPWSTLYARGVEAGRVELESYGDSARAGKTMSASDVQSDPLGAGFEDALRSARGQRTNLEIAEGSTATVVHPTFGKGQVIRIHESDDPALTVAFPGGERRVLARLVEPVGGRPESALREVRVRTLPTRREQAAAAEVAAMAAMAGGDVDVERLRPGIAQGVRRRRRKGEREARVRMIDRDRPVMSGSGKLEPWAKLYSAGKRAGKKALKEAGKRRLRVGESLAIAEIQTQPFRAGYEDALRQARGVPSNVSIAEAKPASAAVGKFAPVGFGQRRAGGGRERMAASETAVAPLAFREMALAVGHPVPGPGADDATLQRLRRMGQEAAIEYLRGVPKGTRISGIRYTAADREVDPYGAGYNEVLLRASGQVPAVSEAQSRAAAKREAEEEAEQLAALKEFGIARVSTRFATPRPGELYPVRVRYSKHSGGRFTRNKKRRKAKRR